ncbi:hypothetical protein K8I85_06205 [bacterium]|nr:hypothetical protein [bacterium]
MKRNLIGTAAGLLLLPALASASPRADVNVDVHVRIGNAGPHCATVAPTWIDFRPDRGAFVALYAAYSDGSVSLVFPREDWRNHWVEPAPGNSVPVYVPRGLRLESVQAVASPHWFDPHECWVAMAPLHHGSTRYEPTIVTSCQAPLFTWSFAISWGGSHRADLVRTGCRTPLRVVSSGRDAAHPRTDRWNQVERSNSPSRVKVKTVSRTKVSGSGRKTGEPERYSRR